MSALSKYEDGLKTYPKRGSGLHQHVMSVACLGVLAEIPSRQIIQDMEASFIGIKPNEAFDAVKKASTSEFTPQPPMPKPERKPITLDQFIGDNVTDEYELLESSTVYLGNPDNDARLLLETLYKPDEYLFIGDIYDVKVLQVKDWLKTDLNYPHIIPNPMTGGFGVTGTGKESRRCEATVEDARYAVCEMDSIPLEKQVAFWLECIRLKMPVAAVIHSGGKSLHGWMKVDCGKDLEKWEKDVKGWLFGEFGIKYGFDSACSNRARLSRLPSFKRDGKGQQRLLYLKGDK